VQRKGIGRLRDRLACGGKKPPARVFRFDAACSVVRFLFGLLFIVRNRPV
jgi:hypothetical protein